MFSSFFPARHSPTPDPEHTALTRSTQGIRSHGDGYTIFGNLTKSSLAFYFNSSWLYSLFKSFNYSSSVVIQGTTLPFSWASLCTALSIAGVTSISDYIVHSTQDGQNENEHIAAKDSKTRLDAKRTALLVGAYSADILAIAGSLMTISDQTGTSSYFDADETGSWRGLLLFGTFVTASAASWSEFRGHRNSQIAAQEMDDYAASLAEEHRVYGTF
jgi:hypothetical protein